LLGGDTQLFSCIIPWAKFAYLAFGIKVKEQGLQDKAEILVCKFMRVLIATV